MLKNATYKEKYAMLRTWLPSIIETVKKDLKNEHLKNDLQFCKVYLQGRNPSKLTVQELIEAYSSALDSEGSEVLAEFISNRWLLKNSELYGFFEEKLRAIHPNFTEIDEIDTNTSQIIVKEAVSLFGPIRTYLFSVINSVVFPKAIYDELEKQAERHVEQEERQSQAMEEQQTFEAMQERYELRLARLEDKYEKKLNGLQKKYQHDMDALKKQISHLQRKVNNTV